MILHTVPNKCVGNTRKRAKVLPRKIWDEYLGHPTINNSSDDDEDDDMMMMTMVMMTIW